MKNKFLLTLIAVSFFCYRPFDAWSKVPTHNSPYQKAEPKRNLKYKYTYVDREHSVKEIFQQLGSIYVISWGTYYLSQPETFREEGSFKKYADHLGEVVFDKDEPFWNWMVHPYSGSQLYLFYRAYGYSQTNAVLMSVASSTLFEFFVEIYTEPASFQDLYQTPILGSALGLLFEKSSLYLLNTGNPVAKVIGHILNPATLFWFYEGKITITPQPQKQGMGLTLNMDF